MTSEVRRHRYRRFDGMFVGAMKLATGILLWDIATNVDALGLARGWAVLIAAWASYFAVLGATGMAAACLPVRILDRLMAWVERRRRG